VFKHQAAHAFTWRRHKRLPERPAHCSPALLSVRRVRSVPCRTRLSAPLPMRSWASWSRWPRR